MRSEPRTASASAGPTSVDNGPGSRHAAATAVAYWRSARCARTGAPSPRGRPALRPEADPTPGDSPLVLRSVGGGLFIAPLLKTVLSRVSAETVGMASAVLSVPHQVGGAPGVAVIGAVFFSSFDPADDGKADAAGNAFAMSSLTTFGMAVLASALVFLLPEQARTGKRRRAGVGNDGAGCRGRSRTAFAWRWCQRGVARSSSMMRRALPTASASPDCRAVLAAQSRASI